MLRAGGRLNLPNRPRKCIRRGLAQAAHESVKARDARAAEVNVALHLGVVFGPEPLAADAVTLFSKQLRTRQSELDASMRDVRVRVPHSPRARRIAGGGGVPLFAGHQHQLASPSRASRYCARRRACQAQLEGEQGRVSAEILRLQSQGATAAGSLREKESQLVRRTDAGRPLDKPPRGRSLRQCV